MSGLSLTDRGGVFDQSSGEWRDPNAPARRSDAGGVSRGWVIAGVAVLALGFVAWRQFGPDFRRYIKIRSM